MKSAVAGKLRLAVWAALALLLIWAIFSRLTKEEAFAAPVSTPVVEAQYPEERDIRTTSEITGTVEPAQVVYVYPDSQGEVKSVDVKAGDHVSEGQQICVIDTEQLESAENSLKSAELSLREANDELNRQTILYQSGGISEQAYQQYKNQAESAQLQYESAKLNYDTQYEYTYIKAPISGVIETCNIKTFDKVTTSDLLFVISGAGDKVVTFSVTERMRTGMNEGDEIAIGKDSAEYTGYISELSTMPDSSTGLYKIKATISGDSDLATGTSVKLSVTMDKADGVMSIPTDDIYYENGKNIVYVYDNGTVHEAEVETGLSDNEYTEIKSGLSYSDMVITTWSSELYEGAEVRLPDSSTEEYDQESENAEGAEVTESATEASEAAEN